MNSTATQATQVILRKYGLEQFTPFYKPLKLRSLKSEN